MLRDYALGWVLVVLFLMSLTIQWLTHDGTIGQFVNAVFENAQSEFLQLLAFVVLTAFLRFRGSPESKSSDEEHSKRFDNIERKVDQLISYWHQSKRRNGP